MRETDGYQLEKEVVRNTLEEMDILNDGEEQEVCNTRTNGFWQAIQGLLLFQSFCFELEAYVRQNLILYVWGQLISSGKFWSSSDCIPLQDRLSMKKHAISGEKK